MLHWCKIIKGQKSVGYKNAARKLSKIVKVSWSNITQEHIFSPSKTNYNSNENSGHTIVRYNNDENTGLEVL